MQSAVKHCSNMKQWIWNRSEGELYLFSSSLAEAMINRYLCWVTYRSETTLQQSKGCKIMWQIRQQTIHHFHDWSSNPSNKLHHLARVITLLLLTRLIFFLRMLTSILCGFFLLEIKWVNTKIDMFKSLQSRLRDVAVNNFLPVKIC